jgi:hypothetical protein
MIYKIQHAFNSRKFHMILWDIIKIIFYSRTRVNIKYPHHDSSPFCSSIVCLSLFPLITSCCYYSLFFDQVCALLAVLLNFSFFIMTPHSFDGLLFNPSYHFFVFYNCLFIALLPHLC